MQVAHVVPAIQQQASGPSYSVPQLCSALARDGVSVQLHVLGEPGRPVNGFPICSYGSWPVLRRLGISPQMQQGLSAAARVCDLIHNHSLWMMPNVYPARAIRGTCCRLVTSPRGTLSQYALRRSGFRKRVMWWLCQGRAVLESDCLHATAESELRDIRDTGLRMPVAVIPNAVDVPPALAREQNPERRVLLFLGRVHPIKGVDLLLRAWAVVEPRFPAWDLVIAGPDNGGCLPQMQALAADLGLKRVKFVGPLYGSAKAEAYRGAEAFVLPTHSENFGMAVAEALSYGVPVIVTKGAPWSEVVSHRCGWWIDTGVSALAECLDEVLTLSAPELAQRGELGRAWMLQDYSWERVGRMMRETYQWLLGGGAAPPWVAVA